MSSSITLPFWLFLLVCLFAVWAALDRLLVPSVRWYLRRRLQRVIEELNQRLPLRIQHFKVTKRRILIDRLMYDPIVIEAAEKHARENGLPRREVMREVERYAKEIVPSFNAYAYFRLGFRFARRVARLLYRVRLTYSDDQGLSQIDPEAGVVFIINHRSNMDYVLVAYLAADLSALSYAVGEWARVWPLQTLVRLLGGYFVRRNSGNPLYRRVLARYVHHATAGGVVQAVFPEGNLSRDGSIRPPKMGLLNYMVMGFDPQGPRDLLFIPVGLNYDRVLEDRSLVMRLQNPGEKKSGAYALRTTLRFMRRNLWLMLRGRWYRFGYASVSFGTPISLKAYLKRRGIDFSRMEEQTRFAEVEALGKMLMDEVKRVIPVLPVSLVVTAFLSNPESWLSEFELKARVHGLIKELEARGNHVYIPRQDLDYSVKVGLRMLTLRHLLEEKEGLYRPQTEELPLLTFYANSIAHMFQKEQG